MSCAKKKRTSNAVFCIAVLTTIAFPAAAFAQVANFSFTTDSQAIAAGAVSGQMTVQAQDSTGASVYVPQTTCLSFYTASAQGQFSSSATSWIPISVLSMSKNSANRSFFYKDATDGIHMLTVKIAQKPAEVSSSCASWPLDQWNIEWTATQNITIGNAPPSDSSGTSIATTSPQTTTSGNSSSDYIMPPPPKVFADGGSDRTVIVGADTEFKARAYDAKKDVIEFSRFHWNFGDGSTADVATTLHHFDYPGRYVVMLDIPEEKNSVPDQIIVTVEPMQLALSLMPDGGVALENRANRTLDLSRWIIRSRGQSFSIPDHTFVLANNIVRVSQRTLGFLSGPDVELDYPNTVTALRIVPDPPPIPPAASSPVKKEEPQRTPVVQEEIQTPDDPITPVSNSEATTTAEAASPQVAAVGTATTGSSRMWWFGVFGLATLAAGSLAAARRFGKKEWDIIEETAETR